MPNFVAIFLLHEFDAASILQFQISTCIHAIHRLLVLDTRESIIQLVLFEFALSAKTWNFYHVK